MARLSQPGVTVCKFPVHRSYAVTHVSGTGFEPGAVRFRIQHATTRLPCHTQQIHNLDCILRMVLEMQIWRSYCMPLKTRSSPRWRLLDFRSPVWRLGQSCAFAHGITPQTANVFLVALYLHISSVSDHPAEIYKGTFRLLVWEVTGDVADRRQARSIAHLWAHISFPLTHIWSLSCRFFLVFSWLQRSPKSFPSVRPSESDTMTITALEAITSSSGQKCYSRLLVLSSCRK